MFLRGLNILLLSTAFTLCSVFAFAQSDSTSLDSIPKEQLKGPSKPSISLGIGMLAFRGDIRDYGYGNPLVSRVGYELMATQRLNDFFFFKFRMMHGKVGISESTVNRNLNFESKLTTGELGLLYNFDNLLPKKRSVSPYLSVGVAAIEFHSKTDMVDAYGNTYYYWSDGSIMNMDENDPDAANAKRIQRDYVYETDLREQDFDGKGKYPERTWGFPVAGGITFHLNKRMDFNVTTTYTYTLTDLIDNVSKASTGEWVSGVPGNKKNDAYWFNSVSLSYDFTRESKSSIPDGENEFFDLLAYDQDDYDGDGVIDWFDKCPQTPPGVEVDENGCPLDEDKDLVANYKDDELGTTAGVPVTPKGVELTDEMILQQYLQYLDSAAHYEMAEDAERIERKFNIGEQFKAKNAVRFVVKVGGENGLTPEDMEKLLAIPDVSISTQDGKNYVTVGDYSNVPDAVKRKIELTKQGINETEVVKKDNEGNLTSLGDETNNMMVDASSNSSSNEDAEKVIYRVQIGAFSNKKPKNTFKGQDVLEFYTSDNLYKYVTGSSSTYEEAAANRDKLRAMGYEGAFVVAYKSGSRAKLSELGVTSNVKNEVVNENVENINPDLIEFKVQVGIYKNQLPTEVLEMFLSLEDISQTTLESGATRYTSGEFKSYAEAEKYKSSLVERGLTNAFIISSYEGQLISVDKAKKLKP